MLVIHPHQNDIARAGTARWPGSKIALLYLLTSLVVATGCRTVSTSFAIKEHVLVKVAYSGEPANQVSSTGWRFKPLVAITTNEEQTVSAEWFMVWPPNGRNLQISGWGSVAAWKKIRQLTPELADVVHEVFHDYPMVIEPNLVFGEEANAAAVIKTNTFTTSVIAAKAPSVLVQNGPSKVWPMQKNSAGQSQPLWYLGSSFSQLLDARQFVEANAPASQSNIRIGILDCGYDASHVAMPEQVENEPEGNAVNMLRTAGDPAPISPGATGTAHGTGTIGILAGRQVSLESKPGGASVEPVAGYLGAAPHATIVPVLVAPYVFSIETADLAYGIDYASRVKQCDVISMSHGGAPSLIWADAVNSAYERGTAIFAAAGDFYSLAGTDMGVLVPSSTVYPAGFRRVVAVTGVTADGKTYAKNGIWHLLMHPCSVQDWLFRGSYGADLQSRWLFGSMKDPDPAQVGDNGLLHPYPIAAYSPNIPWATTSTDPSTGGARNRIDLNGAGTSAATPQVAAAAALWLQQNYREITQSNDWHSWKKAEAVYVALLASAARAKPGQPDQYLGAGILKARDALDQDFTAINAMEDTRKLRDKNEKAGIRPALGFSKAPRDFYDGERSAVQLIWPWRRQPPFSARANLRQSPHLARAEALKNLFFNDFLLEKYEWGTTPKSGPEEDRLAARAEKLVQELDGLAP